MPDSMSIERRRLMLAYGASFDLTQREKGMKSSIARAQELQTQTPGSWVPQQFENLANIDVHVAVTAQEILADFPDGLDAVITGVLDGVIQIDAEPAREYAPRSAREEGVLVGISSGATLAAIAQKLTELPAGSRVLVFNYDTGECYLSVEGFLPT